MDGTRFRETLGAFPTGVTVVTAPGPAGLTTNAFSSLSLTPALVLVCFDNGSRTLSSVRSSRRFAVNVLRASQESLARLFASKLESAAKFEAAEHRLDGDVPVLADPLAWLRCDLVDLIASGDHTIGIGAVLDLSVSEGDALVFFRGRYGAI